ncbi:MAG TPA: class I SAM-dependent methyltransferase [Acidimicrobiia bacterium]|nr:class I SAM-dependent methyltransferase [Acidimicrobiia bacterium]
MSDSGLPSHIRPFEASARVYDVVYSHLDYQVSALQVEELIRRRNPGASSLLDMSCGTGLHLSIWKDRFDHVEGADVDPAMLEVARERLGDDVPLHVADYVDFDLGRTFDAVTCMFSSIGYARTPDRLDAAIGAMARHLEPGGVLVVEPWLQPDMVIPGHIGGTVSTGDGIVVLRSSRTEYDGDESGGETALEFVYVVRTPEGSDTFTERHVMGVWPSSRYLEAMARAGLDAEFLDGLTELGRGIAIGTAP